METTPLHIKIQSTKPESRCPAPSTHAAHRPTAQASSSLDMNTQAVPSSRVKNKTSAFTTNKTSASTAEGLALTTSTTQTPTWPHTGVGKLALSRQLANGQRR